MERFLIVTDIDGTLIPPTQKVSTLTKTVLTRLRDEGHEVYIASGRMLALAKVIADQVDDEMGIIGSNGAVIAENNKVQVTHLGATAVTTARQVAEEFGLSFRLFTQTATYHNVTDENVLAHMNKLRQKTTSPMVFLADGEMVPGLNETVTNGLLVDDHNDGRLTKARAALASAANMALSSSSPNNIELIPKGISKATGLAIVQNQVGIATDRTIVFGNGHNDVPLFKKAAISVAMADAPAEVRTAANHVTVPAEQDGVAHFLMDYFKLTDLSGGNQ
ncbi:HAD family hydrolase [Furfurilactobacillus entadae]|uniref:HAD family hydrolase n=1 Tax=Furfurilactobacillus entadae TaxID=2922307 RepID=UPI0035E5DFBA